MKTNKRKTPHINTEEVYKKKHKRNIQTELENKATAETYKGKVQVKKQKTKQKNHTKERRKRNIQTNTNKT